MAELAIPTRDAHSATHANLGRTLRMCFYYLYVACLLGVNVVVLIPRTAAGEPISNSVFSASWVALHGLTLVVLLSLLGKQDPRNLTFVAGFGALVLASAAWSVAPTTTLIYGGMMVGNILVAHLIASELPFEEVTVMLTRIIFALCLLGIIAYYLKYSPVYYFDDHQRLNFLGGVPFRGFFSHKVMASLFAVIGAVGILSTTRGARRVVCLSVLALFVALTGSATGVVLFLLALALYAVSSMLLRSRLLLRDFFIILAVFVTVSVLLVVANWSSILGDLGRDSTLTGRTYLWESGMFAWMERPILGWGFDAYFDSPNATLINSQFRALGDYAVPHFHQSFLQTAVDLGIVGLVLLVAILASVLIWSYDYANRVKNGSGIFSLVVTVIMTVAAFTMFLFFNYNHFATFLLFLLFFMLRKLREAGGCAAKKTVEVSSSLPDDDPIRQAGRRVLSPEVGRLSHGRRRAVKALRRGN